MYDSISRFSSLFRPPGAPASSRRGDTPPRSRGGALVALVSLFAGIFFATAAPGQVGAGTSNDTFRALRESMVEQVRSRGLDEPHLLEALGQVPRHRFVPEEKASLAYDDRPIEVAAGQTLSQAYLSAVMIDLLELDGDERVLEIGTGTGYDAALLSRLVKEVYTIEIDRDLAREAERTLDELGYDNVHVRQADGYHGWPEEAPFDAILLTAAPHRIPRPLLDQLAPGGRMVVAVGAALHQDLKLITKNADGETTQRRITPISLCPMKGEVDQRRD